MDVTGSSSVPRYGSLLAEQVKLASNILDVIGEHVELRKAGRTLRGSCPFHTSESGRSFTVDPQKQLWYCFGCRLGGDAITFVMQLEGLSFPAAVRRLAARAGLETELGQHLQQPTPPQFQLAGIEFKAFDHWLHLRRRRLVERQGLIRDREQVALEAAEVCFSGFDLPPNTAAAIQTTLTFCHVATAAIEELIRRIEQNPSEFVQEFLHDFYGNHDLREVLR